MPYSEDENLMHISHEAGVLEDPSARPDASVFSMTNGISDAPGKETLLEIEFENGMPTQVKNLDDGTIKIDSLEMFLYLNEMGSLHGIGRVDMVENRFIGIKSRGVYETPGATILWEAHRDLEGVAMDKEVMHIRDMLIPKFAELIYNGFWFSPEMDFLLTSINKSQEAVDGTVRVVLHWTDSLRKLCRLRVQRRDKWIGSPTVSLSLELCFGESVSIFYSHQGSGTCFSIAQNVAKCRTP